MVLNKQIIPISFSGGIDTITDDKQVVPGKLLNLQNGRFTHPGKIQKRNGFDSLTTDIIGGGVAGAGVALNVFQDELLLYDNIYVYNYIPSSGAWSNRGDAVSVIANINSVVRNNNFQFDADANYLHGYEVYAYQDSSGGINYTAIDSESKGVIIANEQISADGYNCKIISGEDAVFIFYVVNNTLRYRAFLWYLPFNLPAEVTLINNINGNYDISVFNNKICITYNSTTAFTIYSKWYTASFDNLILSQTVTVTGQNAPHALSTRTDFNGNLWIAISQASNIVYTIKIDSAGVADLNYVLVESLLHPALRIAMYQPSVGEPMHLFYEIAEDDIPNYIRTATVALNDTVSSPADFVRGAGLYSKIHLLDSKPIFMLTTESPLQSTYILYNINGNSGDGAVIGRYNATVGGGYRTTSLLSEIPFTDGYGQVFLPIQTKGRTVSENNVLFSIIGLSSVYLNFEDSNQFLSSTLTNNLHIVGGIVQNYDGVSFNEHNFLFYPEDIASNTTVFTIEVTQQGTGIQPEIFLVHCVDANRIEAGTYFTCHSSPVGDNTAYYVWFSVDGEGTDPAVAGRTGIQVDIDSTDLAFDVAEKLQDELNLVSSGTAFNAYHGGDFVFVTNIDNGVTPDAANFNVSLDGYMDPGNYLYKATYEWIDNYGQIQRSTTSVPLSVTISDSNSATIQIPTLKFTTKKTSDKLVQICLYRTEVGESTLYYKITSTLAPLLNDYSVDFVYFLDTLSDVDLIDNELIYTTGGVLDNACPPACSLMTIYRNRLWLAGIEDPNVLWFSKVNSPGNPVDFAAEFTMNCISQGGGITGLHTLDEKLIIFKNNSIFYLAGNGPNDLGVDNDFQGVTPQLITSSVGCINPNSIVRYDQGIAFQSLKGIWLLDTGTNLSYIGAPVNLYNNFEITSATLISEDNQLRFTTNDGYTLVYDYFVQQWSTDTTLNFSDSDIWKEQYTCLIEEETQVKVEDDGFIDALLEDPIYISLNLTTSWLRVCDLQGYQRVYHLYLLNTYYSNHTLKVSVSYNYDDTIVDQAEFTVDGTLNPSQFKIPLSNQKCQALKVQIQDLDQNGSGESFDISAMTLMVGVKSGTNKTKAAGIKPASRL